MPASIFDQSTLQYSTVQ